MHYHSDVHVNTSVVWTVNLPCNNWLGGILNLGLPVVASLIGGAWFWSTLLSTIDNASVMRSTAVLR